MSRRNSAVAAASCSRSIGIENCLRNCVALPSRPGATTWKMDHNSLSRFSIGVPVSAMRWPALIARIARAVRVSGFFTACASSSTNVAHGTC